MSWWIWLIIGLGAGGAGGAGAMIYMDDEEESVEVVEALLAPSQALTDLDLIKPICEPSFLASHGPLLCREMFCRMMQRGIDKASDTACEAIANINNKRAIIEHCHTLHQDDKDNYRQCIEIFDRRI